MKFLYLTQIYSAYNDLFYSRCPKLIEASFEEQRISFAKDAFSWNGVWESVLEPYGFEVTQIICNALPMQKAWAKENDCAIDEKNLPKFTLEQIKFFQPEILFAGVPRSFDRHWIKKVREECPSVKKILFYVGTSSFDASTLRECDSVLVPTKWWRDEFISKGISSYFLPHAFNKNVFKFLAPNNQVKPQKITFSGSIGGYNGEHESREKILKFLIEKEIQLELNSPTHGVSQLSDLFQTFGRKVAYILIKVLQIMGLNNDLVRGLPVIGRANRWRKFPRRLVDPLLRPYLKPPIFGMEMYQLLQNSFVTLNSHISEVGNQAGNCRLFEATGVGTCLLTDARSNLSDFFEPDYEVVTYDSPAECFEKINYLKENPSERDKIAERGRKRTLSDHTFEQRSKSLMEVISSIN